MISHLEVPKEFWADMLSEEFEEVCRTGVLDRKQCLRLWALLGRVDAVPKRLMVAVKQSDVERMIERTQG